MVRLSAGREGHIAVTMHLRLSVNGCGAANTL